MFGDYNLIRTRDCTLGTCAPALQKRKPQEKIIHPSWDKEHPELGNDIALVRLDKPVRIIMNAVSI